jgi:uncharacterized damage-inducible protein DinB
MIAEEVKKNAIFRIQRSASRIATCFNFLDETEIWKDFNPHLVSVGNLLLHVMGNITQHIISGLGNEPYTRQRDREFTGKPNLTKTQLLDQFTVTIEKAVQVIERLQDEDLARMYWIQGHEYSGVGDILTVVEHLSYHVGQITWAVKYFKNVDVAYTAGIDLNQQNLPADHR